MNKIYENLANSIRDEALSDMECGIIEPFQETDSPIESGLFVALVAYQRFSRTAIKLAPFGAGSDDSLRIETQMQIGDYRVDFCFGIRPFHPNGYKDGLPSKVYADPVYLVVECDGHDFHERTPEQAMRDRARDRNLQLQGFTVFRFTGREINRDPWMCAWQIFRWAELARWLHAPSIEGEAF